MFHEFRIIVLISATVRRSPKPVISVAERSSANTQFWGCLKPKKLVSLVEFPNLHPPPPRSGSIPIFFASLLPCLQLYSVNPGSTRAHFHEPVERIHVVGVKVIVKRNSAAAGRKMHVNP